MRRSIEILDGMPLVAILRGLTEAEAPGVAEALVSAGIRVMEVPLSGPGSLDAVAALRRCVGDEVLIGAGTVLTVEQVGAVDIAGGDLVVSPHLDERVVAATRARGGISMPGVATPTEAFRALAAGADVLKLFPGEQLPPAIVRAWRAVLGPPARLYPVGGVGPGNLAEYVAAGAAGFGIGGWLYAPMRPPEEVHARALDLCARWRNLAPRGGALRTEPG